jgi:hypothetical protein
MNTTEQQMSKNARYATIQDAEAKRKFCVFHVTVSANGLVIKRSSDIVPAVIGKDSVYRYGSMGAIDVTPLGQVNARSSGTYDCSATVIDYAENAHLALEVAKEYAQARRAAYVEHLQAHLNEMTTAELIIQ